MQPLKVFCKKGALKNSKFKIHWKTPESLFNKAAVEAYNFNKKEALAQMFSSEFYEIFKSNFCAERF